MVRISADMCAYVHTYVYVYRYMQTCFTIFLYRYFGPCGFEPPLSSCLSSAGTFLSLARASFSALGLVLGELGVATPFGCGSLRGANGRRGKAGRVEDENDEDDKFSCCCTEQTRGQFEID